MFSIILMNIVYFIFGFMVTIWCTAITLWAISFIAAWIAEFYEITRRL